MRIRYEDTPIDEAPRPRHFNYETTLRPGSTWPLLLPNLPPD